MKAIKISLLNDIIKSPSAYIVDGLYYVLSYFYKTMFTSLLQL